MKESAQLSKLKAKKEKGCKSCGGRLLKIFQAMSVAIYALFE